MVLMLHCPPLTFAFSARHRKKILVNLDGNLAEGNCCFVSLLVSFLVSVMAHGVPCSLGSRHGGVM